MYKMVALYWHVQHVRRPQPSPLATPGSSSSVTDGGKQRSPGLMPRAQQHRSKRGGMHHQQIANQDDGGGPVGAAKIKVADDGIGVDHAPVWG